MLHKKRNNETFGTIDGNAQGGSCIIFTNQQLSHP